MLGQYGLGSSGSYGQQRAPMGFGGGRQFGSTPQVSYGAYTPPQGLGQTPQTQYSSYTPPQNSGLGSQPSYPQQMGASQRGFLGGETQNQTLGNGQYYHVQPDFFMGPKGYGIGGGTGAISRADANRLNQSSSGFMKLETLPGMAATNIPGSSYNMLTGLVEQTPTQGLVAPQQQQDNGLGGMTFDPLTNSWRY